MAGIKGVVIARRHVLLVLNDRDQWELPGGRLERGESPVLCVEREIHEETGLSVTAQVAQNLNNGEFR